jgi:hypothetical protein
VNRIILIGNDFDLAHELKTSYKDFIEDFCRNIFEEIHHNGIRVFYRNNIDYNNKVKNIDRFLGNRDVNDLLVTYNNCEPLKQVNRAV